MKFDWRHYISEQLHLADSLLSKADEIQGFENEKLFVIAQSTLRDVSRLAGRIGADGSSCS